MGLGYECEVDEQDRDIQGFTNVFLVYNKRMYVKCIVLIADSHIKEQSPKFRQPLQKVRLISEHFSSQIIQ